MISKKLRIEFEHNWRKFRRVLIETSPQIVETFRGTTLENNFSNWYELAVPQNGESPINFLLRNARLSYATTSQHHGTELATNNLMAIIGWYFGKIPLLKKIA